MIRATFNLTNDTKKTDHEFKGGQLEFWGNGSNPVVLI